MKKQVHHQVVDDVSKSPDERYGEERNAEQDDVQHDGQQQVGEPYSSAVHHPRVGVHLAVSHAHIHLKYRGETKWKSSGCWKQAHVDSGTTNILFNHLAL